MGLRISDIDKKRGLNTPSPTHVDYYQKQMSEAKAFGQREVEQNNVYDSLVDLKKMLPADFEIVGWQLPDDSEEVTRDMIEKAVNKMQVNTGVKLNKRDFMVVYKHGDIEVTTANDGTVWFLDKSKDLPEWVRMKESGYPELPQD